MTHPNRPLKIFHHQVDHSQKPPIREKGRTWIRKRRIIETIGKFLQVVEEVGMIVAVVMTNLTEGIPDALSFDERF